MTCWVSRNQVITRIRDAGWKYNDSTPRVEIYKKVGGAQRMDVVKRDHLPESYIRATLKQAGLTKPEIESFLTAAVKSETPPGH